MSHSVIFGPQPIQGCCNCKYSVDEPESYLCVRRSPQAGIVDNQQVTFWPKVSALHWCGEFDCRPPDGYRKLLYIGGTENGQ
jgi:hypothetical protein